jgi:diacylglycerol O-acyltransferase / wax synthase
MDRMNPLDASFLHIEDGVTHMHIASCAVFAGPPPAYDELIAYMASKLPSMPRYRQRVRFVPFDLGRPVWVDDPHFRLEHHVRHTALPRPGDEAALTTLMGRLMSQELDRAHPLWEWWIVDGLEHDHWALISKVHHCMVDGIAGVDLLEALLDAEPVPQPGTGVAWTTPEREPSDVQLAVGAIAERLIKPFEYGRTVLSATRRPRQAIDRARTVVEGLGSYARSLSSTPPTSFDGHIGPYRSWAVARSSLDDVRTVKAAFGGSVNDVVLSAIAGGFRELIETRGEDPTSAHLRTLVPVSVRTPDARGVYDNRVSAIFYDLPVGIEDPVERLAAVRAGMLVLKDSHEPEAGEALVAMVDALPNPVVAQTLRVGSRLLHRLPQRTMNTVTTNVPGPRQPLYLFGKEMLEYLPYVPIGQGVRVGVAILTYNGRIAFGVTGDFDTAPDVAVLARGIEQGMRGLLKRAEA